MKPKERTAFLFYFDWANILLDEYPYDLRHSILEAILLYITKREEPTDPTVKYSMFTVIKKRIAEDTEAYAEKCERVKQARREAGLRGNEKRWNLSQTSQTSQMSQTSLDSDSDNDRDKDIDKEKSTNVDTKKTAKRFSPPSLDEVRDYIASQSYSVDAEAFIDFYEAKGWRVGNNPMKDWKAAVRTWERRNKEEGKTAAKKQDGNTQTDMNRPSDTPRTVDNCGVSVTLGVGEWIDAYGRRTYGSGKATIPEDAPPRPGDKYTWDAATKSWIYL